MDFDVNRPIYLQICDVICEKILDGSLKPADRIPSVREYGALVGLNPNTVARSYEKLTEAGIIFNKRGIGFFVSDDARNIVLKKERETFIEKELPQLLKRMSLLGIDPKEILK